jgi:hypothetical protein
MQPDPPSFEFADMVWQAREGVGPPRDNHWWEREPAVELVYTDDDTTPNAVILRTYYTDGQWYSAEIFTTQPIPYGEYCIFVDSWLDQLDADLVFGMFLYQDDTRELDIEYSLWGENHALTNAQFAVQRGYGNAFISPFQMTFNGSYSTHCIDWKPDAVIFSSYHGHVQTSNALEHRWIYDRRYPGFNPQHIPLAGETRLHLNLWLQNNDQPELTQETEIRITDILYRN